MAKITVFLNNDVLFSAACANDGLSQARLLFELQRKGLLHVYVSSFVCQEVCQNISRKFPSQSKLLETLISETKVLDDFPIFYGHLLRNRLPDADRLVLSTAVSNRISYFLTGNEMDFGQLYGKRLGATTILRPAEFLNRR